VTSTVQHVIPVRKVLLNLGLEKAPVPSYSRIFILVIPVRPCGLLERKDNCKNLTEWRYIRFHLRTSRGSHVDSVDYDVRRMNMDCTLVCTEVHKIGQLVFMLTSEFQSAAERSGTADSEVSI
jgi:hypothetical protein